MKHKQTLRRGLGVLLSLVLCLSLLPATALADEPATGTADFATDSGALEVLGGDSVATWDNSTRTLTLKGVNFTTTAETAVKLPDGATIVLADGTTNTITSIYLGSERRSGGIYVEGGLTIQGSGTLTVKGGTMTGTYAMSCGIFVYSYYDSSSGTSVSGRLTISGGTVTATATGGTAYGSYGIYAESDVTITGGTVTATGGEAGNKSYGIFASADVNISGGHVTARTLAEDSAGTKSALNKAPVLEAYANNIWRTSPNVPFTTDTAYENSVTYTYVEFYDGSTYVSYGVTVNDVAVTSLNKDDVLGDGLVRYDPATNTVYKADGFLATLNVAGNGSTDVVLGEDTIAFLTVTGAKNVTGTDVLISAWANITCTGDVTFNNKQYSVGGLTVTEARNVTVISSCPGRPAIQSSATINCSGDVTISNTGGGKAVRGTLTYQNAGGDHSYTVKTGASLENLTVYVEVAVGETFGPESLTDSAVKISVSHTAGAWQTSSTQHWQVCTVCGIELNRADHTFSGKTCSVCGYTKTSTGGNTSGGNTFGGNNASVYAITVESAQNGTVTVSPANAVRGADVTLTVIPDKGYTLETLTVTDAGGREIELLNRGNGQYTFKMPGSMVTVKATFMEDNSMLNFFVDVFPGDYYYDAVLWAAENGITGGVDDTHFAPDAPCTRAQMVTFLWRAAGCPEPGAVSSFADVSADAYYAKAVAWAVENGITAGVGDNRFAPDDVCTRAQMVTFLCRMADGKAVGSTNAFTDVSADAYYAEAVQWAVENGITKGTGDTTFSPDAECTRAQIVTFLYRCFVK